MKKRLMALLLALTMVVSILPVSVFAVDTEPTQDVVSSLDKDGNNAINYVALGDSMTNGFGMPGYYLLYTKHEKELWWNPWGWNGTDWTGAWEPHPDGTWHDDCELTTGPYILKSTLDQDNSFGYLSNALEAYPTLLSDDIKAATGKEVNLLNMAISGMREIGRAHV